MSLDHHHQLHRGRNDTNSHVPNHVNPINHHAPVRLSNRPGPQQLSKDNLKISKPMAALCKRLGYSKKVTEQRRNMDLAARRTELLLHSPESAIDRNVKYRSAYHLHAAHKYNAGTSGPRKFFGGHLNRINYEIECEEDKVAYVSNPDFALIKKDDENQGTPQLIAPPDVKAARGSINDDKRKGKKTGRWKRGGGGGGSTSFLQRLKLTQANVRLYGSRKDEEEYLQEMAPSRRVRYLSETTKFSVAEVLALQRIHAKLCEHCNTPDKGMDRITFIEIISKIFGITQDLILDQLFHYFDMDGKGSISDTEWIKNLSVMLRGSLKEQAQFCFDIYDLSREGTLDRFQLQAFIQGSLTQVAGIDEDWRDYNYVRDLVDMLCKKVGEPGDRLLITAKSFIKAVQDDPLLLQCLGKCLPDHDCAQAFLALITEDYNNFSLHYSHPLYPGFNRNSVPQKEYVETTIRPHPGEQRESMWAILNNAVRNREYSNSST